MVSVDYMKKTFDFLSRWFFHVRVERKEEKIHSSLVAKSFDKKVVRSFSSYFETFYFLMSLVFTSSVRLPVDLSGCAQRFYFAATPVVK